MEYNLQRFIKAQDDYGTYDRALSEVEFGRKTSHWIWYIFPQIKGLGHSHNSNYYALQSLLEAVRYLDDPVLGSRLREITVAVLEHRDKDIEDIMGSRLDAVKFRSSMTLFDLVSPNDIFAEAIDTFFSGKRDPRTIAAIQYVPDDTMMKTEGIDYRNTTLFIAGLYAFGLVCFPIFAILFDLIGLEPFPRALSVCLSAWICWLVILFFRKIRILPMRIKAKTGAKNLAILTTFFFLQLLIIDQMAGPYRGSNIAAGINPLYGRSIGLAIWYWTALILELYFGMQLICTAPIQHWIQKERVKNTSIVLICFSFMLYGISILANSPVKFMHRADITGVLILLCVTLLQPLTIWLVVVILRSIGKLIYGNKTWKEVFLFKTQ